MLKKSDTPLVAVEVSPRAQATIYPPPFASRVAGRIKRRLGDHFGLTKLGINFTTLEPGSQSALLHRHTLQEEFVYIVAGTAVLRTGEAEHELSAGMCIGFRPDGPAHHLLNRSDQPVHYLEIGDRPGGDAADYPEDDLVAQMVDGAWATTHREGSPW